MREGKFAEAIATYAGLIARGRSGDIDHLAAYDLRLFDVFSYDAIAACHLRLGNYAESRRYYQMAAAQEPDQLEYRVKLALCSNLQVRAAGLTASV